MDVKTDGVGHSFPAIERALSLWEARNGSSAKPESAYKTKSSKSTKNISRARNQVQNGNKRRGILAATNKRRTLQQKRPLRNRKTNSDAGLITEMATGIGDALEQRLISHFSQECKNGQDKLDSDDLYSDDLCGDMLIKTKAVEEADNVDVIEEGSVLRSRVGLIETQSDASEEFLACQAPTKGTAALVKQKLEQLMKTEQGRTQLDKILRKMIKA